MVRPPKVPAEPVLQGVTRVLNLKAPGQVAVRAATSPLRAAGRRSGAVSETGAEVAAAQKAHLASDHDEALAGTEALRRAEAQTAGQSLGLAQAKISRLLGGEAFLQRALRCNVAEIDDLLPGATRQVLYADAIAFWVTELGRLPASSLRAKLKDRLEDRVREALGRKLDEVEDAVRRSARTSADQLRFDSADLGEVQLPASTADSLRLGPDHLTGFLSPAQPPTLQKLPGHASELLVSGTLDLRTQIEIKGRQNVGDGLRQHAATPHRLRQGWLRAGTLTFLVPSPTQLLHVLVAPDSKRWAAAVKALHVQHPNRALAVQFPTILSGAAAAYVNDVVADTYEIVRATSHH